MWHISQHPADIKFKLDQWSHAVSHHEARKTFENDLAHPGLENNEKKGSNQVHQKKGHKGNETEADLEETEGPTQRHPFELESWRGWRHRQDGHRVRDGCHGESRSLVVLDSHLGDLGWDTKAPCDAARVRTDHKASCRQGPCEKQDKDTRDTHGS
jgi:hypothetical protein